MTPQKDPARLAGEAGRDDCGCGHSTDVAIQLRVLGGIIAYPELRETIRASGLPLAALFDREVPRELAVAAMEEREPRIAATRFEEREFFEVFAHIFTPTDAAWAHDLFRLLATGRACKALPALLRWGADAIANAWAPTGDVRETIARAFAEAAA